MPILTKLAGKLHMQPGYLLAFFVSIACLVVFEFFGMGILTTAIGIIYPSIQSLRALEVEDDQGKPKDNDKFWITYWIVFGFFAFLDQFRVPILLIMPWFNYFKVAIFVWMMAPQTQGAFAIYKFVLRPLLLKNKIEIDKFVDNLRGKSLKLAHELLGVVQNPEEDEIMDKGQSK